MIISQYLLKLKVNQSRKPLLGIDLGTKFTGFSLSSDLITAYPIDIHYSNFSVDDRNIYIKILELIKKEGLCGIVIGQTKKKQSYIKEFTNQLEGCLLQNKVQCYLSHVNEDLTTLRAQQLQYKMNRTNNKMANDGLAAMLILQKFLNELKLS